MCRNIQCGLCGGRREVVALIISLNHPSSSSVPENTNGGGDDPSSVDSGSDAHAADASGGDPLEDTN